MIQVKVKKQVHVHVKYIIMHAQYNVQENFANGCDLSKIQL